MKLEAKPIVLNGKPKPYRAPITRNTPTAELQQRLRELRKARGMSQQDVADLLGCSQKAISYWENQSRNIDWRVMVKLLSIYDVRVEVVR